MLGGWLLQVTSYPVLFAAAVVGPVLVWVVAMGLPDSDAASQGNS